MDIRDYFQKYVQYFGEYCGDTFDILRPDYTQVDNTPVTVASMITYRMDPNSPNFSEPKLRDLDWYELFGDRTIIQPGDIFRKTVDDGMTPIVTLAHWMPIKAAVGYRTTRLCNITNQIDDPIYTNVYFDFVGISFPGSSVNKKLEDSLRIPSTRVVLHKRDNIFRLRNYLIETDSNAQISIDGAAPTQYQRKWKIEEIDYTGSLMVLTLSNALKD